MTKRAQAITDHLNKNFFTDKKIAALANFTEDAIVLINGLKNAADALTDARDEISGARKGLMCAIDSLDRDAVEAMEKQLSAYVESIASNPLLSSIVDFGRAIKAKRAGADEVYTLEIADVATAAKKAK